MSQSGLIDLCIVGAPMAVQLAGAGPAQVHNALLGNHEEASVP